MARSEALKRAQKKYYDKHMAWFQSIKDPCAKCGEADPRCISFHHVDPATKSFDIGGKSSKSKILKEKEKCICLCFNCHAKEHGHLYIDNI